MNRWRHAILVFIVCLVTALIYANVTGAYFCAYDDFLEVHRAAFEDSRHPSRTFTTSHFDSLKYRPLNRLLGVWTYQAGAGSPLFFRVRNLASHLVNIVLVYALGWLLFGSPPLSAAAAALFGLHPLANQPVIGALWTNTIAHTGYLLAITAFMVSLQAKRWTVWLAAALASGGLALLTYDSSIVVFPLMAIYLALYVWIFRRRVMPAHFPAAFCAITAALMAAYFVLRFAFVSRGWSQAAEIVPTPGVVLKNISMYLFALLSPLDTVLANEWLHLPLPSEIDLGRFIPAALAVLALLVATALAAVRHAVKGDPTAARRIDWAAVLFLVSAIGLPLLPVLLLSSHPSETYLYLSVAFYALLLAYALGRVIDAVSIHKKATVYAFVVVILAAILSAGTWTRNDRVLTCATTAQRIIRALPAELSTGGPWTVSFAPAPEPPHSPYGFYAHRGVYTLGDDDSAVTAALQFAYGNPLVTGKLVEPERSNGHCRGDVSSRQICLVVHSDGRVERIRGRVPSALEGTPAVLEPNRFPNGGKNEPSP